MIDLDTLKKEYNAVLKDKIIYIFRKPKDEITSLLINMETKISIEEAIKINSNKDYEYWCVGMVEDTELEKEIYQLLDKI